LESIIGGQLAASGFYEMMNNSLTSPAYISYSKDLVEEDSIAILNPLSAELSVLRQSMLFNGLETISYNVNRKRHNLKMFEFGKTYHQGKTGREEHKHLCLFVTGNLHADSWTGKDQQADFFFLKSTVENILMRLGIKKTNSMMVQGDIFSEGIALTSEKDILVEFGVIQKSIIKQFDLKQEVLYADFNWANVLATLGKNEIIFKEISKYPEVKRDFALLLDKTINFKAIHELAFQTEKVFLADVSLFDVYTGSNLPEGKKSYAVSFTLKNDKSTLTDKQIDKIMNGLQQRFEKDLGAELR
jgi:phenylalanyl-tRNA synthetase beta chain